MATYSDRDLAIRIAREFAQIGNSIIALSSHAEALRAELLALTSTRQDEIRQAIRDFGLDDTEVVARMNKLHNVDTAINNEQLNTVPVPS